MRSTRRHLGHCRTLPRGVSAAAAIIAIVKANDHVHCGVRLLDGTRTRNEDRMDGSAFRLSRIYGQGWNAAKQLLANHAESPSPTQSEALNPYRSAEERTRWSKGFEEGLLSRSVAHARGTLRSRAR